MPLFPAIDGVMDCARDAGSGENLPSASELIRPLLLLGGRSTRMGRPKHLLQLPDGRLLFQRQLDLLCATCPDAPNVYISMAKDTDLDTAIDGSMHMPQEHMSHGTGGSRVPSQSRTCNIRLIFDAGISTTPESAGPASGLLAAFTSCAAATWLVLACDYPLLTLEALHQLKSAYIPPVTCFRNKEGYCEPLVGIWGPDALSRLAENHARGASSPSSVVRELGGLTITPENQSEMALWNVNTPADWEVALDCLGR